MIYSFIATCKTAGIEPREWFENLIRRIPEYENGKSDVTNLLSKNWKAGSKDCNQINVKRLHAKLIDFNKVIPTLTKPFNVN